MEQHTSNKDVYEVAIIGASLAGSCLANLLAPHFSSIALIDKPSPSAQKACGEGLSSVGKSLLKEMGLWSKQLESGSTPFYGYSITTHRGTTCSLVPTTSTKRSPDGVIVPRSILDTHLLQRALTFKNVDLIPNRVTRITTEENGHTLRLSGSHTTLRARVVILATGATPTKLHPHSRRKSLRNSLTLRCTGSWSKPPPQEVVIKQLPLREYFLGVVNERQVNLSALLSIQDSSPLTSRADLRQELLSFGKAFGFTPTLIESSVGSAYLQSDRLHCPPGLLALGDALEVFDPAGGMGMTHAICSALCAASVLVNKREATHTEQQQTFEHLRAPIALRLRTLTRLSCALNVQRWRVASIIAARLPAAVTLSIDTLKSQTLAASSLIIHDLLTSHDNSTVA